MSDIVSAAIELRESRPDDREFLLHVYMTTRADEMAVVPWTDEQKRAFLRTQAEAQDADYRRSWPQARFLVVVAGDHDIGRLYRRETDDELHLIDIALLPEWRNQGIGTSLMNDLIGEADRQGKRLTLYVENWNPARRLYERLGFVDASSDAVYAFMERPAS